MGLRRQEQPSELISRQIKEQAWRHSFVDSQDPWRACFSCHLSFPRISEARFDENFVGWGPEDREFAYRLCVHNDFLPVYRSDINAYHLESIVGNIYRNPSPESIEAYLRNCCYLQGRWPQMRLEDVFPGVDRLLLDKSTDQWVVAKNHNPACNITERVETIRRWLERRNGGI